MGWGIEPEEGFGKKQTLTEGLVLHTKRKIKKT